MRQNSLSLRWVLRYYWLFCRFLGTNHNLIKYCDDCVTCDLVGSSSRSLNFFKRRNYDWGTINGQDAVWGIIWYFRIVLKELDFISAMKCIKIYLYYFIRLWLSLRRKYNSSLWTCIFQNILKFKQYAYR